MPSAREPNKFYALKDADTFLVADAFGDINGAGDGFFRDDTRTLSRLQLTLNGEKPSLLSASVSRDNVFFVSNMTNLPLPVLGGSATPQGVIHIERTRFLWDQHLHERIACTNYCSVEIGLSLQLAMGADFYDMFEVRGVSRRARGRLAPPQARGKQLVFVYEGLDGVQRISIVEFSQNPDQLDGDRAEFNLILEAGSRWELYLEAGPDLTIPPDKKTFRSAAARARYAMRARSRRGARLHSSGRLFNEWIEKSRADLALLTTELPTGPYPYAGIPWFSVPFGRDAIITALQLLWLDSGLARGVLRFLAQYQARAVSSFQDAAPGKIMHERRRGEMTRLRELPFGEYYGGVDTTPLFVVLAGAYAERTGDLALVEELWPALTAACVWIETITDSHPDGFLTYARAAETGLANQGWKDSEDSIFHTDGRFPRGPVALVEVQGYVFGAFRAMSELSSRRGDVDAATQWKVRADRLQTAVEARFWMEDAGFYGVAVDGDGQLCRTRCSNPGHLLYVGLPSADRGRRVSQVLLSDAFHSGWGLRTLAPGQARFNPMSYHNGSVWPHDTALCAAGIARYHERVGVIRMINSLFEAAVSFGMQLPELFCGFARAPGEPPVAYPVACLPQAWAAGSLFMLLQACLGVKVDGWGGQILIEEPSLPVGIDHLTIRHINVGGDLIDLAFHRVGEQVVAVPDRKKGKTVPVVVRV
ncbi:MAG: amylo-alpha,6-glucosidase [Verrucomicrobiaceae bacterium]|nr:amylo-alpha,6-glucosidase [Verrucomicrobiaceae bacterium]